MTQKPITSLSQIPDDTYVTLLGPIRVSSTYEVASLTVKHKAGVGEQIVLLGTHAGGQWVDDTQPFSEVAFHKGTVLAIW